MSTYEDYPDPTGIRVLERLSDHFPGCTIIISHLPYRVNDEVCEYRWSGRVVDELGAEIFGCFDCDCIGELLLSMSISFSDYRRSL
jgi:hypothetical protein